MPLLQTLFAAENVAIINHYLDKQLYSSIHPWRTTWKQIYIEAELDLEWNEDRL